MRRVTSVVAVIGVLLAAGVAWGNTLAIAFESRFAEWMIQAGSTVYVASQIAYILTRFLRR